jgi:outer membrane immunogenic protein
VPTRLSPSWSAHREFSSKAASNAGSEVPKAKGNERAKIARSDTRTTGRHADSLFWVGSFLPVGPTVPGRLDRLIGLTAGVQVPVLCSAMERIEFPSENAEGIVRALLVATAAMLAMSAVNPASAADMPVKAPPVQPPPTPVYNWTGFYIGGNVGYGWSHGDFTNTITATLGDIQRTASNSGSIKGEGVLGGGQIGFNYEFPSHWVLGIEADIDATHITSSTSGCFTGAGQITTAVCGTRNNKLEDFGTVRGRLGYAFNNVLVYGTGGWAWGHGTNTLQITCLGPECPGTSALPPTTPSPASIGVNPNGWVAGGGVEWGFLPNWTLRAEYLHLQFDGITEDRSITGFVVPVLITSHLVTDTHVDIVRVGVNYLFNWPSSVVARY